MKAHSTTHRFYARVLIGLVSANLMACQSTPVTIPTMPQQVVVTPVVVVSTPEPVNPVIRQGLPSAAEPPLTSQPLPNSTPEPATKPVIASLPPQPRSTATRQGRHIPAVTHLLTLGRQQLAANQLDNAEQSFTQAQRLAPNNPAVYAYLSNIALQQQQGKRAEAMARHGLILTRYAAQQKAFWQLIQLAGQQQRLSAVVLEAEREMAKLP
ncbi:MAG: hypothetical protein RL180_574 [Pseudomonadota bacterium]